MSSNEVVISAQDLGKAYRLYAHPQDRLMHTLFWRFGRDYGQVFWALQNVSFELRRGEMMGVVGRNGGGKSTLLQILAGTLRPTTGTMQATGRVAALLELGSGFNPEFSGRENIYLNAAMLGLSRTQVNQKLDEIIAFADIGDFIEQPVKLYSSGMFVRLAFAVTTGLDPDILLVDEALAVGDVFFRQKCYQRLSALRERGAAIVLVTHNMVEVEQFCSRAILLRRGSLLLQGSASEVIKHYYLQEQEERVRPDPVSTHPAASRHQEPEGAVLDWPVATSFLPIEHLAQIANGMATCTGIAVCDENGNASLSFASGETAVFFYEFLALTNLDVPIGGLVLQDDKNIIAHGKNALQLDISLPNFVPAGAKIRFRQRIKLDLKPGQYTFEVGLVSISVSEYQNRKNIPSQEWQAHFVRICHVPKVGPVQVTFPLRHGVSFLPHIGLANLPGEIEAAVVEA